MIIDKFFQNLNSGSISIWVAQFSIVEFENNAAQLYLVTALSISNLYIDPIKSK